MNNDLENATFLNDIEFFINTTINELTEESINESTEESINESTEESINESTEESINESTEESTEESTGESTEESTEESTNKCINYNLCNQFKNTNFEYCNDCFLYFYKKIEVIYSQHAICPICINISENNQYIKLYMCDHLICTKCIYKIYWDKEYLKNIPINPYPRLEKLWKSFLKTIIGKQLTCKVIYKIENLSTNILTDFNDNYEYHIKKINIKRIPKALLKNLKDLVLYQITYNKFINDNNYNKYIMKRSIEKCPYCRSDKLM